MIDEVVLFLEGKQDSLLARLQHEMSDAAEHMNFEAAARAARPHRRRAARDREPEGRLEVAPRHGSDRGRARAQGQACMQVFMVRGGKLIGQEHFILDGVARSAATTS